MVLSLKEDLIPVPIEGNGQNCLTFSLPEWVTLSKAFSTNTYEEYHPIYVLQAMSAQSTTNDSEAFRIVKAYYSNCTSNLVQKLFILEYLLRLGCIEWIKQLISAPSPEPENEELHKVFYIYIAQAEAQTDDAELIDRAFNLSSSCLEINIATIIAHLHGISRLRLQDPFNKLIKAVEPMLLLCKDPDLLTIFKIQLSEMYLVSILCRSTNPEHVRRACQLYLKKEGLLKQFPTLELSLSHIIAHSYMFDSFTDAKKWIMKGMSLIKNVHPQRQSFLEISLQSSLDTFRSLWKVELDAPTSSLSEKAFRLMVTGQTEPGTNILETLYLEKGALTLFEHFYLAIAKGPDAIKDVENLFIHSRNYYYAQLIDFYLSEAHKKA